MSRRVKSFPIAPRIDPATGREGAALLLTVTASDRVGLLYSIARVLAAHGIDLNWPRSLPGRAWKDMFSSVLLRRQHAKTS